MQHIAQKGKRWILALVVYFGNFGFGVEIICPASPYQYLSFAMMKIPSNSRTFDVSYSSQYILTLVGCLEV